MDEQISSPLPLSVIAVGQQSSGRERKGVEEAALAAEAEDWGGGSNRDSHCILSV